MAKPGPKYEFHFRWGNFRLTINGRRTILLWGALIGALVGAKVYGARLLELL